MSLTATSFGQGPELVMLPGWAMPAAVLLPWARQLARRWRVTLIELPGQGADAGGTDFLSLPEILAHALPRRAVWLGWSLGAQLLLAAAERAVPAGLFLMSAAPRFCQAEDWPHGVPIAELRAMIRGLRRDPDKVVASFLVLLASAGRDSRHAAAALAHAIEAAPARPPALLNGLLALQDSDARQTLAQLTCPTCWLVGDQDPLVSVAAVRMAAAAMPRAWAAVLPEQGHMPFLTDAAAVEAELDQLRLQVLAHV
jgi:pimeloyl-[acyl-carrier protein] methyl ester esterase